MGEKEGRTDMIIKGAKVYTKDHMFEQKDIYMTGERITAGGEGPVIDAEGLMAIPGLVDIHLHGAAGHDICEGTKEAFDAVCSYEAERGVLAFCPATMCLAKDEISGILRALSSYESEGAVIAGIYLEGPFINPVKAGAQDKENIIPFDPELLRSFQKDAGGMIKTVCLAPECMENMDDISSCPEGVHLSLGHTDCDYDTAARAFSLGADHLTHSFNAMNGMHHRRPGPVPAAAEAGAYAELIADGVHIHPAVLRQALRIFGEDRAVFVSDSMMAAGMPDGEYLLGGRKVTVSEGKAVLSEDPSVIAGSAEALFGCMRKAVSYGISLETAVRCAAENPARSIGMEKDLGTLEEGAYANIVLMDDDMDIRGIILKGRMIKNEIFR